MIISNLYFSGHSHIPPTRTNSSGSYQATIYLQNCAPLYVLVESNDS